MNTNTDGVSAMSAELSPRMLHNDIRQDARNEVALDGHIDAAFKAVMYENNPDAVHAILVRLAHASVEAGLKHGFAAAG